MKKLLILILTVTYICIGATGSVTSEVFMYKGIGEDTEVINIIPNGAYVKLLFAKDQWAYVKYQDTKGNVLRDKVAKLEIPTLPIQNDEDIRLYAEATTESEALKLLEFGDPVDIIKEDGDFYLVLFDGFTGYIPARALKPPAFVNAATAEESKESTAFDGNSPASDDDEIKHLEQPDTVVLSGVGINKDGDEMPLDIVDGEDFYTISSESMRGAPGDTIRDGSLPYEYFPVRRDGVYQPGSDSISSDGLKKISPDEIFTEGENPNESRFGDESMTQYADGIAYRSVGPEDNQIDYYPDYSNANEPIENQNPNFVPSENDYYVPTVHIEQPGYSRAYSKYRTHVGVKILAGSIFSQSIDWGDGDFQDQVTLYGLQAGTRISRTASGRFGSALKAAFYLSYNSYKNDDYSVEYNVNEFYYIIPVSFGLSYDISNDFSVTGGIGVSAVMNIKEYSFVDDDRWQNLLKETYFSPNAYIEFNYEITPFVLTIGCEYLQWNSDNTEFDIDILGNEIPMHGEIKRHLFGGYGSIGMGF